jgi:hypothetical protein
MAKPELIANLSLADVPVERRAAALRELADSVARQLKERYPAADGYGHQMRQFVRFQERPNLHGQRLWVRRGALWGYRVDVAPADLQSSAARITLTRYSPLTETFAACAAVPAMLLLVGLLIYVVPRWTTYNDYRDPVLILMLPPMGLGLGLFGILRFLAWPFVARKTDQRQIADETATLRQSLHDALVAPA